MADDGTAVRTAREYDRAVLAALPTLALLLAATAVLLGLAVAAVLTGPRAVLAASAAALTAALLAGLGTLGRTGRLPTGTGHALTAGVVLLVIADAAGVVLLTRDRGQLGNVQLAAVLAGAVLVALRWLVAVLAVTWVAWLGCVLAVGSSGSRPGEALGLLAATLLAGVLSEGRRRNLRALIAARDAAEAEAVCDHLTGLANRRGLALLGNQALALARRRGDEVHAVFLDVDGLKSVNDRLGHGAGDAVLCGIANALRSVTRASDAAARWGGDEFCLVGPGPGPQVADLERRVRGWLLAHPPVPPAIWPACISMGAARFGPGEVGSLEELLARADAAMYGGRNRRRAGQRLPAALEDPGQPAAPAGTSV